MKLPQTNSGLERRQDRGLPVGGLRGRSEAFDSVSGYFASKAVRLRERLFDKTNAVSRGLADTTCHSKANFISRGLSSPRSSSAPRARACDPARGQARSSR